MKVKYRLAKIIRATTTSYEIQVRYLEQVSEWETIFVTTNQDVAQDKYDMLVAAGASETILQESDWVVKNEVN